MADSPVAEETPATASEGTAHPEPVDTENADNTDSVMAEDGSDAPVQEATASGDAPSAQQGDAKPDDAVEAVEVASANGQADANADAPDFMKEPPHGAEVFVGGVPRGATEEQIKEYASKVGPVHSCSLVKEPGSTGQNRGYGFVKFMTKEGANKAMQELHQTEMEAFPNMKLRFQPSQSKNKLYLGNIPKDMMKDAIHSKLDEHVKGVVDVEVVMSKDAPGTGRGFCFVEFYNHSAAAHAKGVLGGENFRLGDRTLTVSYAEPKQSEMNQDQVKSVYVGGLTAAATKESLQAFFEGLDNIGEIDQVIIPSKKNDKPYSDYGFVHFKNRASAVKLVEECEASENPRRLEYPPDSGTFLQIKMARPQVKAEQQPGAFAGRGMGRGGFAPRGGRGGRGGYDPYGAYPQQQYGAGYGGGGYGYDANGGYGYGDYSGGYQQYGAGMQMVPMMLPSGQVGYVMQPGAAAAGGSAYGAERGYGRGRSSGGYGSGNQRYRPY